VCGSLAALEAADECGIYPQSLGDLFLSHPGPLAQRAKGVPEDELVLVDADSEGPDAPI
jgi:hypothetical protein